jgi:hypothetical protein
VARSPHDHSLRHPVGQSPVFMRQTSEKVKPVNPYEPPDVASSGQGRRPSIRFSFAFAAALVLNAGLFAAILWMRRQFGNIFVEFDVELPLATTVALSPWTLLCVGALFVFTVAKEFIQRHPTFVRICNGLVCLATLILGFAFGAAIFLPLIGLVKALS